MSLEHASSARLEARGLSVRVGGATLVRAIDLDVRPGRALAIVGRSGSGKSTLARALLGLEDLAGSLRFAGRELVGGPRAAWANLRGRVQLVWQDSSRALDPHLTIHQSLDEARVLAGKPRLGRDDPQLLASLRRVALNPSALEQRPGALSGGQRQRAALARALAAEPAILIADEPTSALDRPLAWTIVDLLRGLRAEGLGLVLITHDMSLLPGTVDEVVVLEDGALVERGPTDEVLGRPRHAITRALVEAAPRLAAGPAPHRSLASSAAPT